MLHFIRQALTEAPNHSRQNSLNAEEQSRIRNYSAFCLTGAPTMLGFSIYHLLKHNYPLSNFIFLCAVMLIGGWYLLYKKVASRTVFRINSVVFGGLLIYMVILGGTDGSKILWAFTFPLIGYFLLGRLEGTIWTAIFFFTCQILLWNPLNFAQPHHYSPDVAFRFTFSFLCVTIITFFYEQFRCTYRAEIEQKNRQLRKEVNERKKTQEALKRSEEKYKAIYRNAAEGILLIDTEGIIIESNPQMNNMLGYTADQLVGLNVHSLIHPDNLAAIPTQIPEVLNGETVLLERKMRTADGEYLEFERSGSLVEKNRVLLLYRDITDRKAAERALETANRELAKLANLDGLTQIANRRKFVSTLHAEWQRLSRERGSLAMILCDIDYFKQFNDIYGHQEGDRCLITLARTLEQTLNRPADLACRFGGEEFMLLLPNTDLAGGRTIAEELRKKIATLKIPHEGSLCSDYITMSFGVGAVVPSVRMSPDELVALTDRALYQAKESGRNLTVISTTVQ